MGIAIGQTEVILGIIGTLVLAECCRRAVGLPILIVAGCFCALRLHRPWHETWWSTTSSIPPTASSVRRSPSARPTLRYSCCSARSLRRPVSPTSSSTARTRWSAGRPAVPEGRGRPSALCGMVSGSSVGNTVTTGSVTIPMMKRTGYPPSLPARSRLRPPPAARSCPHHGRCGVHHHGGNDRL